MRRWIVAVLAAAVMVSGARAQDEGAGEGTGGWSYTPPATKSSGTSEEWPDLPTRDLPIEPRHGMLGAPGAAQDAAGPSRLGPRSMRSSAPSFGERAGADAYEPWRAGDLVRSATSADVRAAREQQAPDLEWVGPAPQGAAGQVAASPSTGSSPEPFGQIFQNEQRRTKR